MSKEAKQYAFMLGIAPSAWGLYQKWKSHNGFKNTGLHALKRDEKRNIVDIPDGIVFPIVSSYSEFCKLKGEEWVIEPPEGFDEAELIAAAKSAYIQIAKSKPLIMGKTDACYTTLRQITAIYKKPTRS